MFMQNDRNFQIHKLLYSNSKTQNVASSLFKTIPLAQSLITERNIETAPLACNACYELLLLSRLALACATFRYWACSKSRNRSSWTNESRANCKDFLSKVG